MDAAKDKILLYLIVVSTILLLSLCIQQSVSTEQQNIGKYDVEKLNNIGKALDAQGRYHEAIRIYDLVLALDPYNKFALNNKGADLYDLGRYEEAIIYFDRRLAIDPNHKHVLYNKASALDGLGRYQEAIMYYNRALAIDPYFFKALVNNGLSHKKLGLYEEAIMYYNRALAIDPNNNDVLQNKANALTAAGRYSEAIQRYNQALDINPNDVDTLNNIGAAFAESGRYETAIEYYDRSLTIDPDNTIALINKAAALIELGRYEEAEKYSKFLASKERLDISFHYQPLKNDHEALYDQNQANVYLVKYGENREYFNTDLGMKLNKIFLEQALFLNNLDRLGESNNLHYIVIEPIISGKGPSGIVDIIVDKVKTVNEGIRLYKSGKYIEKAMQSFVSVLKRDNNSININAACNYYIGLYYLEKVGNFNEARKYTSQANSLNKNYKGDTLVIQTEIKLGL